VHLLRNEYSAEETYRESLSQTTHPVSIVEPTEDRMPEPISCRKSASHPILRKKMKLIVSFGHPSTGCYSLHFR
jgi:hypothetical protein